MKIVENNKSAMVGIQTIGEHSIAKGSEAHIISLVRDKLYPNPLKAAICETICNAIDEHRTHNVKRPVDVIVTNTEIIIRDYARGLSEEQVINVFFAFGASTKNSSNEAIGGFGIGAKAPSAYTPSWVVESRYNGVHSAYNTTLNGSRGVIGKLFEKKCDAEDSGITVRIPVQKPDDKKEMLDLATDMRIQIGFFHDAEELEVYDARDINSYNDLLHVWSTDSAQKDSQRIKSDEYRPWKYLRHENKGGQYLSDVGFIAESARSNFSYYGRIAGLDDNKELFVKCSFKSVFFNKYLNNHKSFNTWLYDGDMLYRTSCTTRNIFASGTFENKLCEYIDNNKSTVILFIPKGKFQIAPSRESVIESDELHNYLNNQWKKLIEYYCSSLKNMYNYMQHNTQDDFFITMCKAQHKFYYPCYTRYLQFDPSHHGYFNNELLSVYTVYSGRTHIGKFKSEVACTEDSVADVYDLETEKWKDSELRGYSTHNKYHWGIVRYVLLPDDDSILQINRIAKAVVLKLAKELTEKQWNYYKTANDSILVAFVKENPIKALSSKFFWMREEDRCWFCNQDVIHLSELAPYMTLINEHAKKLLADARAKAALENKLEKKSKRLTSTNGEVIPEEMLSKTLLFAPSQEDAYSYMRSHFLPSYFRTKSSTVGGVLLQKLLEHLGFIYLAKCTKAEMPYYIRKGATPVDKYDWRMEAYKLVLKPNYVKIPDGLWCLLDRLPGLNEELDRLLESQNKVRDSKGIAKEFGYGVYDVFSAIEKLPTTPNCASRHKKAAEIDRQFFELFEKLSEKDLLTIYYGVELFRIRDRVPHLFEPAYKIMEPIKEHLRKMQATYAEKAAAVVAKKILPKLKMDWNLLEPDKTVIKRTKSKKIKTNTITSTNNN